MSRVKVRKAIYSLDRDTGPDFSNGHVKLRLFDDGAIEFKAVQPIGICLKSALCAEISTLKYHIEQSHGKLEMVRSLLKRINEEGLEDDD